MSLKTIDYAEEAKKLDTEQKERLLSRMSGKLPKRLKKEKLSELEALAIQLELEDEQLVEWKERVDSIRSKEKKTDN